MDSIDEEKSSRETSLEQRQAIAEVASTQDRSPQTLKKSPGQKDGAAIPEAPAWAPTQPFSGLPFLCLHTSLQGMRNMPTTWGQSNHRIHYSSKLKHKR